MRIAMVASTYPRFGDDGAGRFNRSIAEALTKLGHEVHVLVPFEPSIRPYETPVTMHVFRYVWPDRWSIMGYANAMESDRRLKWQAYVLILPFLLSAALKLWRLTRRYTFDAIHAHWAIPNGPVGLFVSRLRGIPLFVSLHGSDVFVARRNRLFARVASWVLRRSAGTTACSPQLYEQALALGSPSVSTHLIPWGADPERFGMVVDSEVLRARLGLGRDARVVLALGRLVGKKGFDVLIRALPLVLESYPEARCVIVGEGPEGRCLRELAESQGVTEQALFAGLAPWSQVGEYLDMCDMLVVPSIHDEGNLDGLPTVVLEAMAARRPVVASDVAGIPLAVHHNESGLLVPEGDPVSLAGAICQVLGDSALWQRLGQAGRRRIERELNWSEVARRFAGMYEGAARRSPCGGD
jgi:glycosyltransferase involved in cell wall biosynthesis